MSRIFVLDDEPLISMMIEEWLTELGHETVGPANNVAGALELIDRSTIHAAILDVSLGREECFPVADALKARGVPFVFATGRMQNEIALRFPEARVLSKPFDFHGMRTALATLLAEAPPADAGRAGPSEAARE